MMAIDIVFDVFITDEYGAEHKVTDKVNDYSESMEVGFLYNICDFILVDFLLPKTLSQDGVPRIRVERVINSVSFSETYLIDNLVTNTKGKTTVTGKTLGALLFEPYAMEVTEVMNHNTYNETFIALLDGLPYTMNLPPIPNNTAFYEIANATYGTTLVSLTEKLGIDVYLDDGKIMFEPIKTISPNDVGVVNFSQVDCTSVSLTNVKSSGLGIISINAENSEVASEASTALILSVEPQPVRPATERSWADPQTGDIYTIIPQDCKVALLYNPLDAIEPTVYGLDMVKQENYLNVEEFDLIEESCITLLGGIKSIVGMTITNGTETEACILSTAQYYTQIGDTVIFTAIPSTTDLTDGNDIQINVTDSGLDQDISSAISGTGTDLDPYIYDIYLGSEENIEAVAPTAELTIQSQFSFTNITETLFLTSIASDSVLNGHIIKMDSTGVVQTSGYVTNASETTFYIDPDKMYSSIAETIYFEIINATDLPFTARLGDIAENIETRAYIEVVTIGTFAGGVDEVYNGQRDNMALTRFVRTDPNIDGILTVEESNDTSNPISLPPTIVTIGGIGTSTSLSSDFNGWSYEPNHNVLCFGGIVTGLVRVSYMTDAYVTTIPNSEYQKNIPIRVEFLDSILKFIHEIRAIDYFPLSYIHRFDVADTWSVDYATAIYGTLTLNSVDNFTGTETFMKTLQADATGILMLHLGLDGYGQYSLTLSGFAPLYIRYYANKYDISFDKIIIKEVEVSECP